MSPLPCQQQTCGKANKIVTELRTAAKVRADLNKTSYSYVICILTGLTTRNHSFKTVRRRVVLAYIYHQNRLYCGENKPKKNKI